MQKELLRSLKKISQDFSYKKYLLAVSGGIDSMVLLHLFMKTGLDFAVAHCNFNLRGDESKRDENFVSEFCKKNNIQLFSENFNTQVFAVEQKISIQEAARELRYGYFYEIAKQNKYNFIVTAHNRDDVLESFFINLYRSSGIKGLSSIPAINGKIIRPMLEMSRTDIEKYSGQEGIAFVEDSSNAEDKYLRNKIRHHLLPLAEEIMPGFAKSTKNSIDRIRTISDTVDSIAEKWLTDHIKNENYSEIDSQRLLQEPFAEQIILNLLKRFNFPPAMAGDVFSALSSEESRFFFAGKYRMVVRKDKLSLGEISEKDDAEYLLYENLECDHISILLSAEFLNFQSAADIDMNKNIHQLNKSKLIFPLKIRRWRAGDRFIPLGMKGSKKVSDYLTDKKLTATDKENTLVLISENEIAAILGYEIGENFALRDFPADALILKISK